MDEVKVKKWCFKGKRLNNLSKFGFLILTNKKTIIRSKGDML